MTWGILFELTQNDLLFLLETIDPGLVPKLDKIRRDPIIIERMLDQESGKLFERVMFSETARLQASISPRFLFEILLRRAFVELQSQSYTVERTAGQKIPVFDSGSVVRLLSNKKILKYLATMLSSFTRVQSFTTSVRIRKGIWRKLRFSDMDMGSLVRLCETAGEERRFTLYQRIADLSLFILGMFPEYTGRDFSSGRASDSIRGGGLSEGYYKEMGRLFYKLAGEHQDARVLDLTDVFSELKENFDLAKKPLSYISEHFLPFRSKELFPFLNQSGL